MTATNPNQLKAANHINGPALVLAGAGSGKTRILTLRILNLVQSQIAGSEQILALTFTNKAADEIRDRLSNMLGADNLFPWMGTFHSISYKILRIFVNELNPDYKKGFTIYDSSDQTRLLKDTIKSLDLDQERKILINTIKETKSKVNEERAIKRLKLVESFIETGQKPEWMILTVVPVLSLIHI